MSRDPVVMAARFHAKYIPEPNSGCWLWDGSLAMSGYGVIRVAGKRTAAHRVSYEIHNGPIGLGMGVLHRCDVRACVNPAHLFLGTNGDNNKDRASKGRSAMGERHGLRVHADARATGDRNGSRKYPERLARGEANPAAKLTDAQVREIRAAYAAGRITQRALGALYGVTQSNVYSITRMKTRVTA